MDIPPILISAILGAIGGGAGALLGGLVNSIFRVNWGRWLSVVGVVVALSLTRYVTPVLDRMTVTDAKVERLLMSYAERIFEPMKRNLPHEYQILVGGMTIALRSGASEADIFSRAESLMAQTRQQYAKHLRFASDADVQTLIGMVADIHDRVYANLGASQCASFAMEGGTYLFRTGNLQFRSSVEEQAGFFFETIGRAMAAPIPHAIPTNYEYAEFLAGPMNRGMPDSYVETITNPDASDPNLCPALVEVLRAASELDGELGERVRADLLVSMFGA